MRLLWPEDEDMRKLDVDASKMDEEWVARTRCGDGVLC